MSGIRAHLDALSDAGDLARIDERTHWADTALAVAAEAARANGPAVLLSDAGGCARLLGGGYGGPDRLAVRSREPWSRIASALGLGYRAGYLDVLDALVAARRGGPTPEVRPAVATVAETDLRSLGLPAVHDTGVPTITLGIGAYATEPNESNDSDTRSSTDEFDVDAVEWFPVRGSIRGSNRLRLSVPTKVSQDLTTGSTFSLALGAPPAALVGALMRWTGETQVAGAPFIANAFCPVPVASPDIGPVPAESEVLVEVTVTESAATDETVHDPERTREPWEDVVSTATIEARTERIATRENPIVPFSPTGAPMADDRLLLSIVESARLYGRVNNYWGVSPVEWLSLPAEAGLGICLVASDILYAGFEWQLANTLFSFSRLFDKVVVLDTETPPMDLARAFDDIWVKAHPANDWEFSDSAAPAARAPHYRRDGSTGANVYVNAAWDPRWDEEYIAPRVTFETMYPADLRASVRAEWTEMGFEHGSEHEPRGWQDPVEGGDEA
ncbi:3-octaprenyl-4-hydroxybenzoate carboxy-lyase [Haloferax namakaokahaiae]|uniref:3-octaprenyl-4-hydroxybenzoate carboxy-lyase n=1 Tax=Haloferax namakaokahaiae TaxID=1748331 RepID=A0ABD5ZDI5_9EURY